MFHSIQCLEVGDLLRSFKIGLAHYEQYVFVFLLFATQNAHQTLRRVDVTLRVNMGKNNPTDK